MKILQPGFLIAFVGEAGLGLLLTLSATAYAAGRDITVEPTCGEARLALVVGNASYSATAPMRNPMDDVRAMAQALRGRPPRPAWSARPVLSC